MSVGPIRIVGTGAFDLRPRARRSPPVQQPMVVRAALSGELRRQNYRSGLNYCQDFSPLPDMYKCHMPHINLNNDIGSYLGGHIRMSYSTHIRVPGYALREGDDRQVAEGLVGF